MKITVDCDPVSALTTQSVSVRAAAMKEPIARGSGHMFHAAELYGRAARLCREADELLERAQSLRPVGEGAPF